MNYEIVGGSLPAVVIRLNAGKCIVCQKSAFLPFKRTDD